jgi:hypothetical protein
MIAAAVQGCSLEHRRSMPQLVRIADHVQRPNHIPLDLERSSRRGLPGRLDLLTSGCVSAERWRTSRDGVVESDLMWLAPVTGLN